MLQHFNMLVGILATPSNLLCFALLAGCLWMIVSRRRRGLSLVVASSLTLLLIGLFPISSLIVIPLENRFPQPALPAHVDGIVVLGGSVSPMVSQARGRPSVREASERLFTTVAMARQYPAARVIVAGGIVNPYPAAISEAAVMRDVLTEMGVERERVELEANSRNTYENALNSYDLARPRPGEVWLLITSSNHMPRAVGCFRKIGWSVIPYPVDYLTTGEAQWSLNFELSKELRRIDIAVHEWVGMAGYRLLGRTDEIFPAPRP